MKHRIRLVFNMDYNKFNRIEEILKKTKAPDRVELKEILHKALECKSLTLEETAKLLFVKDEEDLLEIGNTAGKIKEEIYGKRVVLFAPLYVSNYCSNNCLYCAFRRDNQEIERKVLSIEEILKEVELIEGSGHKRLLLVAGENPKITSIKYLSEAIQRIYERFDIRRININTAPMSIEEFKELKAAQIGTYQMFQETYHPEMYKKMHPQGKKADYQWRYTAFERALKAGIDDIGMGILFGLYDYKYEVLALINHSNELMKEFGVGPHTISMPRLRPATGAVLQKPNYPIEGSEFKNIVAVLRLSVPYTGLILSTRERSEMRNELLRLGISQISAGSHTNPGGYQQGNEKNGQFDIEDHRTLDEVVQSICRGGYIPSFCTACYRKSRTGKVFMNIAKEGDIKEFCQANALLTFKENLLDYASEITKGIGNMIISNEKERIPNINIRKRTEEMLSAIEEGRRDMYF